MSGLRTLTAWLADTDPVLGAVLGGGALITFNAIGALAVLAWRRPSRWLVNTALAFAAGVMLAASLTSLILPGIERAGPAPVLLGMALGTAALPLAGRVLPTRQRLSITPHLDVGHHDSPAGSIWLFIAAVTLHNAPEGLAVGVGFGSGQLIEAVQLTLAVGLQNVPEGLAVAAAALQLGDSRTRAASRVGVYSGLVEFPVAVTGALAVQVVEPLLPYAMGFAAGAMIYVVTGHIVPRTHRLGHPQTTSLALMGGLMVMLYLDVALG